MSDKLWSARPAFLRLRFTPILVFWFSHVFTTPRRKAELFSARWLPVLLGWLTSDLPAPLRSIRLFGLSSRWRSENFQWIGEDRSLFKHAWTEYSLLHLRGRSNELNF